MLVHVPDAADDAGGGVGLGFGPATATPSQEGQEGAPPSEVDAPEATTRACLLLGECTSTSTLRDSRPACCMASWQARGYEDRLCKLLVDMCVTEEEVSP